MKLAMRDSGDFIPRQALFRMAAHGYIALRILGGFDAATQIVRGDGYHRFTNLLRRARRCTTEHDRHAAADGAIRRQRLQRIGAHHADVCRIAFENFTDHGGHQRFVALAG